ncbi:hypothetical protein [Effusibacillus consociatus]|uniref:Fur-regulated basic protein FbpA n=1 Tax=Effusibacillus consociatus TaxID=1117041 RepID=A0ABV9Q7R2_9BACL
MAMTYRREKIQSFIERLEIRQSVLQNKLKQPEYEDQRDFIKGQLFAIDLVIEELHKEFQ